MRDRISTVLHVSVCLGLLLALVAAGPAAANGNGGKYSELTARWWQWVFALDAPTDANGNNTNPLLDTTGEYAARGQEDGIGPANKYFFLAGSFNPGSVERTVTVPAGKTLFFPVINAWVDNTGDPPTTYSVPELKSIAAGFVDSNTSRYARLDGRDLETPRIQSPVFAYFLPDENNLLNVQFGVSGPNFVGRVQPAVSDGYWTVIPPLTPGEHTLEFGGSGGFTLDVIYHLTVQ